MQLKIAVLMSTLTVATAASAQTAPPNDEQLTKQFGAMQLEAGRYYEMLARRALSELTEYRNGAQANIANPQATADWWAAYAAALPKAAAQK